MSWKQGSVGPEGVKGAPGPKGFSGPDGDIGDTGNQGDPGEQVRGHNIITIAAVLVTLENSSLTLSHMVYIIISVLRGQRVYQVFKDLHHCLV